MMNRVVADHIKSSTLLTAAGEVCKGNGTKQKLIHKADKTTTVKKKRKKSASNRKPVGKPNRPLSAYNLFFKQEREAMLKLAGQVDGPDRLDFASMARNIAAKWKTLDGSSRSKLEEQAAIEKTEYKNKVDAWKHAEAMEREQEAQSAVYWPQIEQDLIEPQLVRTAPRSITSEEQTSPALPNNVCEMPVLAVPTSEAIDFALHVTNDDSDDAVHVPPMNTCMSNPEAQPHPSMPAKRKSLSEHKSGSFTITGSFTLTGSFCMQDKPPPSYSVSNEYNKNAVWPNAGATPTPTTSSSPPQQSTATSRMKEMVAQAAMDPSNSERLQKLDQNEMSILYSMFGAQ